MNARPTKTVAIVQSCYIPWKGYFDLINLADEFVLYDDRQFTRRDWRNRNRIKTAQGTRWLTIPVEAKGRYHQRIDETVINDPAWAVRHWETLTHSYGRAPCFAWSRERFEALYRGMTEPHLSRVNRRFIEAVCEVLGISTRLSWSTDYEVDAESTPTERLVALCVAAEATRYLTGPSAQSYLDESLFSAAGIEVVFMDYSGYPEYDQLHPPFEHAVTILDLIFHTGPEAPGYLLSLGTKATANVS
jgi:WbqC-like protein family.